MAVNTRPTTLTAVHNYNLRNQGWPTQFWVSLDTDGKEARLRDPVEHTYNLIGVYPSNADIIYLAKLQAAQDPEALDAYDPFTLRKIVYGNTPAPKGHFIINAFDRDRRGVSGINEIYDPERDQEEFRPVSVAFYSGRIWYLMPDGRLYYSQVLTEIEKAAKCYQESDPTAEDINAVEATDGGFIDIIGISQGLHLMPIRNELAVLADNGVWTISGSGDEAFSAVSQEIRRITHIGAVGRDTVTEADGVIHYWSEGGIYALVENQVTGLLQAVNLAENTIQTFYLDISEVAKENARAFFDKQSKKILWLYNDLATYDGISKPNRYNRILFYDTTLQAFYTYTLPLSAANDTFISAMIQKRPGSTSTATEVITDSSVDVTDSSVDVTVQTVTKTTSDVKLKFLTFVETAANVWQYTFSEFRRNDMLDFYIEDTAGQNFTSHIETGHDIGGDLISEKETNTIYCFFKQTEDSIVTNGVGGITYDRPSGCLMRAKWQWADHVDSGRWSDQEDVYRLQRHYIPSGTGAFDYGFDVVQTINQVRGKGRAISLRFDSVDGKDFHLLGWAIPVTVMTGY